MKRRLLRFLILSLLLSMTGCGKAAAPIQTPAPPAETESPPSTNLPDAPPAAPATEPEEEGAAAELASFAEAKALALSALSAQLREIRSGSYVYRDFSDGENHFTQKALMAGIDASRVHAMDENWQSDPHSGSSCIRCEIESAPGDWGGWLFLSGMLPEGETVPVLNDGMTPGQGMDLSGAETLSFFARGEEGGELVEFFTCGFGDDGESGRKTVPYPDSCGKRSLGVVRLTGNWDRYEISLRGCDLQRVSLGFGFAISGDRSGERNNVFYLDDIRFEGNMECVRPFLRSYETDSIYMKNAAFTYDNALAAMAFLSEGMREEAEDLLNSLVYAVEHDRFAPGRVRNAYCAGDITGAFGSGARLPGWYDTDAGAWYEDRYQVGCNTGNTAYAALALLSYDRLYGSERYLNTAASLMDRILSECTDGGDGFLAGYDGWPEGGVSAVYPYTYKSTEHNIDAFAAFRLLYERTGEERYREAAESALRLILSMYDKERGLFYTGTLDDGVTPSVDNIVLDAQVWTALALGNAFEPFRDALITAKNMALPGGGYPFSSADNSGSWWAEGTAFTALMWRLRGEDDLAAAALNALTGVQMEDGRFPAATADSHFTGIWNYDSSRWCYGPEAHIAPAAWFILAVNGFNPYDPVP